MGSSIGRDFAVKTVAIIGAGPCGLSTAKYLLDRGCFQSIVIFEQQAEVGGIWRYSRETPRPPPIPQTDPFYPPDPPLPPEHDGGGAAATRKAPTYTTPMYERLHANIPKTLMQYHDEPFPDDSWIFPSRQDILQYVVRYAEEIRHLIKFCFRVDKVSLRQEEGGRRDQWDVEAASTVTPGETFSGTFDAVVVANGHYATPFIPAVEGIEAFHAAHPGVITHSKSYRSPGPLAGKKVVVVGNGPSGLDVARQVSEVAARTLLSVRGTPTPADKLAHVRADEVAEIDAFLPGRTRAIRLKDGTVEEGVDAVVYCTGFLFSYPFLVPDLAHGLLTTGHGVHGLYQHVFLRRHPTLAFVGLLVKAVPFQISEAQGAAVAAVWAGALRLPSEEEMEAWERRLAEAKGEALHTFAKHGDDGLYINELHDWVMTAWSSAGQRKKPPYWGEETMWERGIIADAKMRFEKQGGNRPARTLAELGLHTRR
ncbi:thiol-specific monooxygenase [Sodiomyces alkalinus F11]|uniref:Thiol-specific monooxygenase n=1 Tax=Sodiomyces alkalinus (strain CBS 110278 / VKM F-3762 / F11) TaxID=1314773 RepID=A0A3N2PXQ5_SODAK|nr:thiol-specific monooxygenase [Sodiomyces alkalinus F11]ROT39301.1 thiol-specific monooxygenase [Sodiomyces alkalinus F11]